jgi:glycine oxidase
MTDVVVVGGGLIGMLTARALVAAGARVAILERGAVGRESSWAGGGILSPLHPWRYADAVTALAQAGQARYAALCATLAAETGIDPEWTPSGLLMLGLDAEERERAAAWAGRFGYRLEPSDAAATRAHEPRLAAPAAAVWMPEVAQVRNPRLLKALRASLATAGVAFREAAEVSGFTLADGRLDGLRLRDGSRLTAGRVVVAGGAWTGELLAATGLALPVVPVRGQMILFRGPPGLLGRIVLAGNRYLIPRRDGRILAGSTLEAVGFVKETTSEARDDLHAAAVALVPALAELPIEAQWAGLRPGSPTGVPFIGEHPEITGLFVNAGHFRNGVVLGLASAQLAADLVTGQATALDPQPYRLLRPTDPPGWEIDPV